MANLAKNIPNEVRESAEAVAASLGETLLNYRPITDTDPHDATRWVAVRWLVITNISLFEIQPDGVIVRHAGMHPWGDA